MHTPDSHGHEPVEVDASKGYEQSDVQVRGILVFLGALTMFVIAVTGICYVIGMGFFSHFAKEDAKDYGPQTKWANPVDVRKLGSMPNGPEMQNKLAEGVNNYPAPLLQTDDGLDDLMQLHQRESLLIDHYTWADAEHSKVRIPIERAMELVAQRGLPVAAATVDAPLLAGEHKPVVTAPLTTGFVHTGYEHDQEVAQEIRKGKE